ncbi:MAG TPA: YIP1 family protein, partial [Anaerolineaceae bacterium]|nr:YIP1 family protein [Anaerolineaceae bacterium]
DKTFQMEAKKAPGRLIQALIWVVVFTLVSSLLNRFLLQTVPFFETNYIISLVLSIVFIPIVFLFFVYLIRFFYRRWFNRKKEIHDELIYLCAAILFPFQLIVTPTILLPTPWNGIVSWSVQLYSLFLIAWMIKALTHLKWIQSILAVTVSGILGLIGIVAIPTFILSMLRIFPRI